VHISASGLSRVAAGNGDSDVPFIQPDAAVDAGNWSGQLLVVQEVNQALAGSFGFSRP